MNDMKKSNIRWNLLKKPHVLMYESFDEYRIWVSSWRLKRGIIKVWVTKVWMFPAFTLNTRISMCVFVFSSCVSEAETPIEEFAPTPAFPALQYLESVDQGGVAWRAGLRTGDFLIEVGTPACSIKGHSCKFFTKTITIHFSKMIHMQNVLRCRIKILISLNKMYVNV